MSEYATVDLLIETIDEGPGGPLTKEGVELVRKGWEHGQAAMQSEIATLRQQLADAKKENERVRQANLDVMMHFEDMKAAKEKVEARVAELEADNAHQRERRNAARDCINKMNGPWLTRKKAEAIDEAARELMPRIISTPDDPMPEFNAACEMCGEFMDYAQRLRQQAGEAERAGGE